MALRNMVIVVAIVTTFIQKVVGLSLLEPNDITTPYLIKKAGYPVEEHKVTTIDGYILTLHRIPNSPKNTNRSDSTILPVAYLQHGLIASSTDWIGLGPPNALGYLLSDIGYDVWLGNSRGNRYSLQHISLDVKSPAFWNFSFHEMGIYDLPACFEYITNQTGALKLDYIGHSQGTTSFFVYCSTIPTCAETINSAHLMAPVVYTNYWPNPFLNAFSLVFGKPDPLSKLVGSFNFAPNTKLLQIFSEIICTDYANIVGLCADVLYFASGPSNYLNESMIPFLTAVYPADSSFKQVQHYFQNHNSGKFRQFDYGLLENLQTYGSIEPPEYVLSNIFVPTYLYYGENDFLATPKDTLHLATVLPNDIVQGLYKVPPKKWNHIDFLYGMDVKELLYNEVLKNLEEERKAG